MHMLTAGQLALMIPIVAIVFGIGQEMFSRWLKHRERLKLGGGQLANELAALKEELRRLRETSTRYDMSLQQLLDTVSSRLDNLESRVTGVSAASRPDQQTIGANR